MNAGQILINLGQPDICPEALKPLQWFLSSPRLCGWTVCNSLGDRYVYLWPVCMSVWEDNPQALASGLSSIQMHKPCNTYFLIAPACICTDI